MIILEGINAMDSIIILNILKLIVAFANFYLLLMFMLGALSLLAMLGVVNIFNDGPFAKAYFFLTSVIQPPLQVIGRFVPRVGMFDLPFLALLLLLWILVDVCKHYINIINASSFGF